MTKYARAASFSRDTEKGPERAPVLGPMCKRVKVTAAPKKNAVFEICRLLACLQKEARASIRANSERLLRVSIFGKVSAVKAKRRWHR